MVWLPDGEQLLKICLVVLAESTNMMDGHYMTTLATRMHSTTLQT